MARNFRTEGIVLKNNRFGEIHKGVILLSPEHGLLSAVAYGAYSAKGKLRSITNPLCAGTFFLYRDPVKDAIKITDMDCREFFEGIRASIGKFFTAAVCREMVLKTFGGDAEETFSLLRGSLRLLDGCTEETAARLLAQFIWRYLELAGASPDTDACSGCGRRRAEGEGLVYRRGAAGFFCPHCAGDSGGEDRTQGFGTVNLSAGALGYLRYSRGVSLEKAAEAAPDASSFAALKKALLFLAEDLAGGPLNSIRTGSEVL
ncbi:MAG: DNA repair protein RecO [Spirochaetales bacterium]|nr:DNA repair protein RecO [Spirochaetales bacterium]